MHNHDDFYFSQLLTLGFKNMNLYNVGNEAVFGYYQHGTEAI